jgi:hypothetical protein
MTTRNLPAARWVKIQFARPNFISGLLQRDVRSSVPAGGPGNPHDFIVRQKVLLKMLRISDEYWKLFTSTNQTICMQTAGNVGSIGLFWDKFTTAHNYKDVTKHQVFDWGIKILDIALKFVNDDGLLIWI